MLQALFVLLVPALVFVNVPSAGAPGADLRAVDESLAKEGKFVVVGRVMTADGVTPLAGVAVAASAGIGSLWQTGETKTGDDGRFRLVFDPGFRATGGGAGGLAIVHARKPGWHGWSYGWPAEFILSDEPLEPALVPANATNLLPGTPSEVEFRMQPAASLTVKLVDGAGAPMADTRVWLTGDDLPPGASVIADRRTAVDGTLTVEDVPRTSFRLVVIDDDPEGRGELELGSVQFRDAAEYLAVATVHEWTPAATHVSLKVTREPPPPPAATPDEIPDGLEQGGGGGGAQESR
jgi:hypothetical protein